MAIFHQFRVWHAANEQIRLVAQVHTNFGDLDLQVRRAAISVSSNLAEGAGRGSDRDFARFVCFSRGSNDEIAAQLHICSTLGHDVTVALAQNASVGRMLTALIRRLRSAG